jgi:aspartyl-tRNA synthetase
MAELKRKYAKEVFKKKGKVNVKGWVHETRDLGKVRFLILRDITGRIQITGHKGKIGKREWGLLKSINRESVISVKGEIKKSKKAPGGKEIIPDKIEVLSEADSPLPIDVSDFSKTELPKRLDYRFLDLHREKIQAVFNIQSTISMTFRNHFIKKGFIEFQPPSVISSSSEGGTDLFKVGYFDKKAYLAQSPQLYKQMLACSVEKAMTITPVWRAEKHNTTQHLNESRQMDIEMAFSDSKEVMKELEEVVKEIVKNVKENNKEDLEKLDVKLKVPKAKYMTFEEIKKLMEKNKVDMEENDLSKEAEKKLGELFPDTIVFIHDWPIKGKPFYIMPKDGKEDAELSEGFDAIYNGIEISSGGQRIHIPKLLIKMLKKNNLNPKDFESYIDSFRFGSPEHSGWSIGLERLTQVLLGLDNIREVVLFPRDRDRLTP